MNRALVILFALALLLVALAPAALGATHPSQGEHSIGRAETGSAGPHCHLLIVENAQGAIDFIQVFPSHKGHDASGLSDAVFMADSDCDGMP